MERIGLCLLIIFIIASFAYGQVDVEKIFRDPNRHSEQWNNPKMSQFASAPAALQAGFGGSVNAASGVSVPIYNRHAIVDERASDLIASNILQFALNIGKQLGEREYVKSEIFSPVSIMSALALLMVGAKGKSYQQLKQLFGLDLDAEFLRNPNKFHEEFGYMLKDLQIQDVDLLLPTRKNVNWRNTVAHDNIRSTSAAADRDKPFEHVIRVANGLFAQTGFNLNPDYTHVVKSVYHSDLQQLPFHDHIIESANHINAWVNNNTFGKIPTIISNEISSDTSMVIASTLYFKGFWENNFIELATILDDFYTDGPRQRPIKIKMMATGGVFPYYDSPEYNCRIIGLPYKGNLTTMYVIQPYDSTRAKLKELQQFLDSQKIEDMILKMTRRSTVLAFPKMHIVRSINLKNVLNSLGISDIFSIGSSDLSLISDDLASGYIPAQPTRINPIKFTNPPNTQYATPMDRFYESPLIFSRRGELNDSNTEVYTNKQKRQAINNYNVLRSSPSLDRLETQRNSATSYNPHLFVEGIVHKVDFTVNERGTEAAAATSTYLKRSGPEVLFRADSPFLILLRHDPTKLPLFYGIINEPEL